MYITNRKFVKTGCLNNGNLNILKLEAYIHKVLKHY